MGDKNNVASGSMTLFPSLPAGLIEFSLSELETATNDFSEENITGQGAFATVYKGVLPNGRVVAIKKFRILPSDPACICDEAALVSKLQHKNVVKLLGIHVSEITERVVLVEDKDELVQKYNAFLVEEYMPNRSFNDIINGMFLMDLKPSNILLDSDMNPVITDFGIAKRVHDEQTYTEHVIGSIGYLDPLYARSGLISKTCDMFAFGVTLLETIMTMTMTMHRRSPDIGVIRQLDAIEQALNALKDRRLMKKLFDSSQFEKLELEEKKRCIKIGVLCINKVDRSRRPTMLDVLQMLNGKKKIPKTITNEVI